MIKNHSSIDYCYNAQSVVDEKNQIVVGAKVTNNEVDSHQMTMMLDEAKFGCVKHNNGFNRWLYRGLKNVDAQWNLVCTVINLYKLFKVWKENDL